MKMKALGSSDIQVSELCLGSMTWGTTNSYEEAVEQIDYALDHGINFIDTATLYPVHPKLEATQGYTEQLIGRWLAESGRRKEVVLATKILGNGRSDSPGDADITAAKIHQAVADSLVSLQTDYIDLYQLHWPNRGSYHFRQNWRWAPESQSTEAVLDNIHEVLRALDEHVKAGRIRHIGLSNESAWGTAKFLSIAEQNGLPRVVSVQNEYNLTCRLYDLDMAELSHHEKVGLLAFSPLAAGALSGKYRDGTIPPGSRRTHVENLGGRFTEASKPVIDAYVDLAHEHGLKPEHLALAFCLSRPFMNSVILGATTLEQLKSDIQAVDVQLDDSVQDAIAALYRQYPIPY